MTNLEAVTNILASHREARRWSDETVAHAILAQLGIDADGGEPAVVEEDHESIHGPDEIAPVAAETPDTE